MNPPQLASLVILGVGSLWLSTPHRRDKDSGGGGSAGAVPAPEARVVAKVRPAMGSLSRVPLPCSPSQHWSSPPDSGVGAA